MMLLVPHLVLTGVPGLPSGYNWKSFFMVFIWVLFCFLRKIMKSCSFTGTKTIFNLHDHYAKGYQTRLWILFCKKPITMYLCWGFRLQIHLWMNNSLFAESLFCYSLIRWFANYYFLSFVSSRLRKQWIKICLIGKTLITTSIRWYLPSLSTNQKLNPGLKSPSYTAPIFTQIY